MENETNFGTLLNRCNETIGRHSRLAGGVLFVITFAVLQGSLKGTFVFDDIPQILQNPYLANSNYWRQVFQGAIDPYRGPLMHANYYRPLQFLCYWAVDKFAGLNPQYFHLFQLCLCAGTVWLLFLLGRELLGNDLAAFAGALLWALHPMHVEVVAWIAALPDAGAAFFMIGAFTLFLRAEKADTHSLARHVLAALVYLPALFFKEVALCFPLLLISYWIFLGAKVSWARRLVRMLPYVVAVSAYVVARIAALGHFSAAAQSSKVTLRTVGIAVGIVGKHAQFFFWPVDLNLARTFDLAASLRSPWPWLAVVTMVAAFIFRKREPMLGFLIAWWGITLLPCLDVRQVVGLPMADRFSYLPSVGPCLAMAYAVIVLAPRHLRMPESTRILVPAMLVVLGLWVVQDIRTVPNWRDDAALWSHTAKAAPDSALAHMFEAIILEHQVGNLDAAAKEYQAALRLNAASVNPTTGMIYECDLGLGRIALMKGSTDTAENFYRKAVNVAPVLSPAYRALGTLYFPQGNYEKSAQYFIRTVQIDPQDVEARFFLGTCWLKLGKPEQAAEQFRAARKVDATYYQAYAAEAGAWERAGNSAEAARVRALAPKH